MAVAVEGVFEPGYFDQAMTISIVNPVVEVVITSAIPDPVGHSQS